MRVISKLELSPLNTHLVRSNLVVLDESAFLSFIIESSVFSQISRQMAAVRQKQL